MQNKSMNFLSWQTDGADGGNYLQNKDSLRRLQDERYLDGHGYKVYSQNDEDGILQEIFSRIGLTNKRFVEFGVQNGLECNTHYLLMQGWTGMWLEGSENSYWEIQWRFAPALADGRLRVKQAFIDAENITELLRDAGGELDLLSVDIDGNDYYVMKSILESKVVTPRVIVAEYNGKWPADFSWVAPYDPKHVWDYSDSYGVSLLALTEMLEGYGYALVGTNTIGANAFYVKREELGDRFPYALTAKNLYNTKRELPFVKIHDAKRFCDTKRFSKKHLNIRPWPEDASTMLENRTIFVRGGGELGRCIARMLEGRHVVFVDDHVPSSPAVPSMSVQAFRQYVQDHPDESPCCIIGAIRFFWPMALQLDAEFPHIVCYEPRGLLVQHMTLGESEEDKRIRRFYQELDFEIRSSIWFSIG